MTPEHAREWAIDALRDTRRAAAQHRTSKHDVFSPELVAALLERLRTALGPHGVPGSDIEAD
jgi:hypothetical protein